MKYLSLLFLFMIACGSSSQDSDFSAFDSLNETEESLFKVSGFGARFCPPYASSELYRLRDKQITVGPDDDWMAAINHAQPGTEILLQKGVYELKDYTVYIGRDVTVRGETGNRGNVLIRGQGYDVPSEGLTIVGDNVTVADLSMTEFRNHGIAWKGELGIDAPHIYNVHLFNIGTQMVKGTFGNGNDIKDAVIACSHFNYTSGRVRGDYIAAIDVMSTNNLLVRDNIIENFTGDHSGCEIDGHCIYEAVHPALLIWNQARDTIIERNVFINNNRSIALGLDRGFDGGMVINNFIYREAPGDAGIELRGANNVLVAHNTIYVEKYPGAIEVSNGAGLRIENNLLSSAELRDRGGVTYFAEGNIFSVSSTDFIEPFNFHLVKDAGAFGVCQAIADITTDIEGNARGSKCNAGADAGFP